MRCKPGVRGQYFENNRLVPFLLRGRDSPERFSSGDGASGQGANLLQNKPRPRNLAAVRKLHGLGAHRTRFHSRAAHRFTERILRLRRVPSHTGHLDVLFSLRMPAQASQGFGGAVLGVGVIGLQVGGDQNAPQTLFTLSMRELCPA